ncbi:hypothetical protein BO85DRAFT_488270 [Aspergillus piperis CBS 112811]|uniref:F-box domain-containing protein n=1 Tax=Aspergillus piperis CBS 112811 TaxID=1448313 RepID=A0A8G1R2N4_9EURO|nr:hypothetical protein BO85DRAFT_488270 [Aspergillus piperis CBS 112811]RAH57541.1 hypothetical protein BO85DRAFT_488270 [Aspergillus piperis CBS 112811]
MESHNSVQTVLSVRTILEYILLELDMRTILISASRVNRFWNYTISNSRPIQQALFIQPFRRRNHNSPQGVLNPLLAEAFPGIFQRNSTVFPEHTESKLTFDTFHMVRDPTRTEIYMRENASWRRMLVQQPPARSFGIVSHIGDDTGFRERCEIQRVSEMGPEPPNDGVRMEMLFEILVFHGELHGFMDHATVYWWGDRSGSWVLEYMEGMGLCNASTAPDLILYIPLILPGRREMGSDMEVSGHTPALNYLRSFYQDKGIIPNLNIRDGWETFVKRRRRRWV